MKRIGFSPGIDELGVQGRRSLGLEIQFGQKKHCLASSHSQVLFSPCWWMCNPLQKARMGSCLVPECVISWFSDC